VGVLLLIIALLFVALIIIIPLVEKFGRERSQEELHKLSSISVTLMVIMIALAGARYLFF